MLSAPAPTVAVLPVTSITITTYEYTTKNPRLADPLTTTDNIIISPVISWLIIPSSLFPSSCGIITLMLPFMFVLVHYCIIMMEQCFYLRRIIVTGHRKHQLASFKDPPTE
uniref:Uncharacterized protein n=1 Tax=Leptocylindrus danicus TaxID=163516 RepID=A0A7S2NQF6_9STRA